jgi:spore coat polysaccharide biosynthesis protein SpsF
VKTVAIIQARMNSTRLPGKVMKNLCGHSVLAHVVQRVKECSLLDEIVVATTISAADDAIDSECQKLNVHCFRGSESDVLERYYLAAQEYEARVIIRVTSDCPLFDPMLLHEMLEYFSLQVSKKLSIDYYSNCLERSYPRGLDAEIFTYQALEKAFLNAEQAYEKEHVTPYIYQHPEVFALHSKINALDLSFCRWTLDTDEDWKLIREIYNALYIDGELFTTEEVFNLMERRPELPLLNVHVHQK